MAKKHSQAEPVRSQDIRSVRTDQDQDEPVPHTAAFEDGIDPDDSEGLEEAPEHQQKSDRG